MYKFELLDTSMDGRLSWDDLDQPLGFTEMHNAMLAIEEDAKHYSKVLYTASIPPMLLTLSV